MSTPRISNEAVQNATGKSWDAWFELLHEIGAAELSHPEIAARLVDKYGVPAWWSQSITVEFERSIGRREMGQTNAGEYGATTSKTLPGDMDDVLQGWQEQVGATRQFDGVALAADPEVTKTDKWRYWRVSLVDGTRVLVNISDKSTGKALLQVNHEKLPDKVAVERWKSYWKEILKNMSAKHVPR